MPAWSDINPAKMRNQLANIWAYRYDRAADAFIGRLAGEQIEHIFGKSFRGRPMRELFAEGEYEAMFRRHQRIVATPALFHGKGFVFRHLMRDGMGERIAMPLADDGVHGDGILGATKYVVLTPEAMAAQANHRPRDEVESFFPLA